MGIGWEHGEKRKALQIVKLCEKSKKKKNKKITKKVNNLLEVWINVDKDDEC